ncbi:phage tail tape measure C-terminal domain-containing protein, partial [Ralstonia sp.]
RTAVELNRLLGRGYADMLPLLQQGSQGIRDAAAASESFADSMARLAPNAGEFNDNLAELRQNAAGAAAGILGVAVPAVNSLHDAIRGILQDASLLDKLFLASPIGLARIGYAARNRLMQQADDARRIAEGTMAVGRLQDGTQPTPTPTPTPPRPAGVTRPAADPLDALLRQTDVRQLQEFERMVGLLNRRFDYGARDADLYTQAMTRLVQTTFADQIRAGDEALRAQAQTMRDNADWAQLEEEHLQGTLDAIEAQAQAWRDAGRALEVEMRTPMEAANAEMTRLDYMLEKGVISWDTYARATIAAMAGIEAAKTATGELADTVDKDMERLTRAVEGWGASFTATMVDIVTGGKASFRDLADSIIADILRIHLQRTVTDPLVGFGLSVLEKMLPARAFGGPVIGGQPYLVGEQGPELFVPRASGSITPNNAIHAGASRTVTVNQVYNFNGPADRGVVMSAAQLGASMARQQIRDDMDRGRL